MHLKHITLAAIAAASMALMASPASAIDILVEVSITPVEEKRAPVAAVDTVHGANHKDFYKAPGGTSADDELWANQCWTSSSKARKTAGTQGAGGVCIWNNGTLASQGGGTRPGTPYEPGLYGQWWAGLDIPDGTSPWDFSHDHDLFHEHEWEE
jgi:hypothetical protein